MPWLPIYALEQDFTEIFDFLSNDNEVAFLVSDGPKRWIATEKLSYSDHTRFCIWHIPSGPLPLLRSSGQGDSFVDNPWKGWKEERTGADPTTPYFGAGHPGIIWLNARANSKRKKDGIGLSSFEWIGNWYRVIGNSAPPQTETFWKRLGKTIKKNAKRVPREGAWDGKKVEIWALTHALSAIQAGKERDENP